MHALRMELGEGLRPLHETFVALIRLFGAKGHAIRGMEILAAMEKLHFDIRQAWLVLVGMVFQEPHTLTILNADHFCLSCTFSIYHKWFSLNVPRGTYEKQSSARCQ